MIPKMFENKQGVLLNYPISTIILFYMRLSCPRGVMDNT